MIVRGISCTLDFGKLYPFGEYRSFVESKKMLIVSGINVVRSVELVFDRGRLLYIYSNGFEEKLVLNQHL